ncbi:hypothetical protein EVAR_60535_1 [Eumeta japonica]|uniref:Uncharacterized protein n=1 Tax=Eumeta variegata TaxID=151549 RepID=A0A4C1YQU6_EUMVA|nr:hypothetical protein EVAR_60535_1 [Eumeta japonica]
MLWIIWLQHENGPARPVIYHNVTEYGCEAAVAFRPLNLAQMVCSVRAAKDTPADSCSSSDYEDDDQRHFEGYASEPSAGILEIAPWSRTLFKTNQRIESSCQCFRQMSSSVEENAAWNSDTELVRTY